MKKTKLALMQSIVALLLCASMLIGTTFAWFTESVSSGNNLIATGNLDVELEYRDADGKWQPVTGDSNLFEEDALWEPGHTEVIFLKISNLGQLALKYQFGVSVVAELGSTNALGEPFKLSDYIQFGVLPAAQEPSFATREDARKAITDVKPINAGYSSEGKLYPAANLPENGAAEQYVTLVAYMPEEVGNAANYQTGANPPKITLGLAVVASQEGYESDSFGTDYDAGAILPEFDFPVPELNDSASSAVTKDENHQLSQSVSLQGSQTGATVPEGVKMNEDAESLTLTVKTLETSGSNLTLDQDESLLSLDVHMEGVSAENTVPMAITLREVAPKGMNSGNLKLYHVENGQTVAMTEVASDAAFTEHNQFKYDPATGDLELYMATFSEVTLVANAVNPWKGGFDYSWYDASKTELTIANADQLAAFGAIVGDMAKDENGNKLQDDFNGDTIRLLSDINLGYGVKDHEYKIFYPIGYHNSTGSYEKTSGGSVTSSVSSFEGTFDGAGHTISNFYQNTWEMFGDYNDGYSGTPNHYKDAMGLFGYVYGGTIKNLTVSNFSSDGEFTPTGVIAAYAAGNATFENIAIFNCNPRVYNTGNGGIIGIAGDTATGNDDHIILKNITVDNSNKISALWGSWDVACGGLVGMYRGNVDASGNETKDTISFENCHVSAQIDVYNDVCGNYQYYAYRYSGMIIGSVRHNTTNTEGKTIPNMTGISATGCTVKFGDWNNYYYCEFVKNSIASYTHDYQFSRVDKSEIVFNESGEITGCTHDHESAGKEMIDGKEVLVEDKTAVHLPFQQLFTGYSWGVSSIGLKNYPGIETDLDITTGDYEASVVKFKAATEAVVEIPNNKAIKASELFAYIEGCGIEVKSDSFHIGITNLDEDSTVTVAEFTTAEAWENSTILLTGTGCIAITVQDYYFCTPTTIEVKVVERQSGEKFVTKFTGDFLYRVGNGNAVSLGSLFAANWEVVSGNVTVAVENTLGDVKAEYVAHDTDWTKSTIKFTGKGKVKVTIEDGDIYCDPTILELEVVDAVNATSATSAKSNNVVLLNDVNFSTIEVSGGYTLYGNGFKMTAANDVMYDAMGVGFVTLKNGTLDNVQIVCPNFSYAIIYNSQIRDDANTAKPSDSSNDARGNVRSAVIADGNSKILDSYIHGGRAAVFLRSGNLLIDNSTISGGAAANIHTVAAQSLTLRDVTLIQKPFEATVHDTTKTIMGFSGLFECDASGAATPLILQGTLVQNAWINESYKQYAPSDTSSIIDTALGKTEYLHDLDGDGINESLNLGFTFIPQELGGSAAAKVTDERSDKEAVPYATVDVGNLMAKAQVYSYKNSNGTSNDFQNTGEYVPSTQGSTVPTLTFTDTNADRVFETVFDSNDKRWESTLTVNLDNGNYTFSFDKLLVQKYGENLTYTVKTADGAKVDISKPIALNASGVTEYIITVGGEDEAEPQANARSSIGTTDDPFTICLIIVATKTSIPEPEIVDTTGGTPLLVVKSKNSDWSCAIPALEGIKVKYHTVDGEVILDLSTLTPASTGKQNGTKNYWETTKDGYKLKVTCGYIHDTKQIYGMPVVVNNGGNKMYFTISSTTGYVSKDTSGRTVTLTYEFTDPNGKTLTFSKTWQFNYADYKDVAQYSYSDFVKGTMTDLLTSGSGSCVTPDTLITLADGSQVRVDSLTGNEQLMVWNMETGKLDSAPILFVDNDPQTEYEIVHLYFSDGTDVKVIYEHGFWDYDLNKYVYLDADAAQYIGHTFAKQNGSELAKVKLTNVVLETEVTTAWSPVTEDHLCYFVNGMLSMPGGVGGLFNIFDVNPETMAYDYEAMARDIETYGLFTYEELNAIAPLSEDMFNAAGGAYLKVSIGKGNLTMEELINMINRYSKFF